MKPLILAARLVYPWQQEVLDKFNGVSGFFFMARVYFFSIVCGVLSAVGMATPVHAGFDFVPAPQPAARVETVEVVRSSDPLPVSPAPVDRIVIPTQDIPVTPVGPDSVSEPVVLTPVTDGPEPQETKEQKEAIKTGRAVYPPPGNKAAAPLSGDRIAAIADPALIRRTSSGDETRIKDTETKPELKDVQQTQSEGRNKTEKGPNVIDGFGNGIPLSLAMEQIVPSDFTVNYRDQPDPDTIVSWAGNRPWDRVLEDMLYAHGYRAMVGQKTVTIFKAGNAPSMTTPNLSAPDLSEGVVVPAPTMNPVPVEKTGYQPQKVDIFSARSGENVRDVLERWSLQSGVQMHWEAGDHFVLKEQAAFNATFARAVEQALSQFRGLAGRPVAELHPNAPMGPVVLNVRSASESSLVVR